MMKVCVIGAGHVGLVTGACFAEIGHEVICVDNDSKKIEKLRNGVMPIFEPGLPEMVSRNVDDQRLRFNTSIEEGVVPSQVIFIAVGTPPGVDGAADLSAVEAVSREIAHSLKGYKVIVEKSTVPVQTGEWVKRTLGENNIHGGEFDVVSNPEFLREGAAIFDFMKPDRIVIGVESERAEKIMQDLYREIDAPLVATDIKSAEIIKHASNSFLALKISYINAIANICERVGADIELVAEGMGLDKRIGCSFLHAGIGYGGSCFPKDVAAFIDISRSVGYEFELLEVVQRVNWRQKQQLVDKLKKNLWTLKNKVIAVLGLSFKPDTDDMREAPSVYIIEGLLAQGAKVRAYDPVAEENARKILPSIEYCRDMYDTIKDSDALAILTEWDEFRKMDLQRVKRLLRTPLIVDGRNLFYLDEMRKAGFLYVSVGRPVVEGS